MRQAATLPAAVGPAAGRLEAAPGFAAICAVDFEASCLPRHGRSFPIEVGVADEAGAVRSWLIRPAPQWRDWTWTEEAEALHGLSRERLHDEGRPVEVVARELEEALHGRLAVADSHLDDGWLQTLMAAAGRPTRSRIEHVEVVADRLDLSRDEIARCIAAVDACAFPRHRAGADAQWLAALVAAMKATRREGLDPRFAPAALPGTSVAERWDLRLAS